MCTNCRIKHSPSDGSDSSITRSLAGIAELDAYSGDTKKGTSDTHPCRHRHRGVYIIAPQLEITDRKKQLKLKTLSEKN